MVLVGVTSTSKETKEFMNKIAKSDEEFDQKTFSVVDFSQLPEVNEKFEDYIGYCGIKPNVYFSNIQINHSLKIKLPLRIMEIYKKIAITTAGPKSATCGSLDGSNCYTFDQLVLRQSTSCPFTLVAFPVEDPKVRVSLQTTKIPAIQILQVDFDGDVIKLINKHLKSFKFALLVEVGSYRLLNSSI